MTKERNFILYLLSVIISLKHRDETFKYVSLNYVIKNKNNNNNNNKNSTCRMLITALEEAKFSSISPT